MTVPVGVELEIDGTWTDVSQRARRMPPTIRRGRDDEQATVAPTTATVVFDNTDGYLTPRNPVSPWYPHIGRNLPCRLSVQAGNPYLALTGNTGSRATTPDNAALDITGDLFLAVEFQSPVNFEQWLSGQRFEICGKWVETSNQRSYHLSIDEFGRLVFFWTTAGTLVSLDGATSTHAVPFRTAGPVSVGVAIDVNVGGTSHAVDFWAYHGTISELVAAVTADPTGTRIGEQVTASGTTSIFSSSAPFDVGDVNDSGGVGTPYPGAIRRVQVRSGNHTGTVVANPDFTAQTVGATGFTDSVSRVWTISGDATLTNKQHRFVGTTSSISLDWPKATPRSGTDQGVATATFEITGILRQLQQGAKPLNSALHRLISSPSVEDFVAGYWPLEDGPDAKTMSSPIAGVQPGSILGASLASDSSLTASEALPTVDAGTLFRWRFDVPPTIAANTNFQSTMVVQIPEAPTSELQFMVVDTSSTQVRTWALQISNTTVRMRGIDHTGTEVVNDTQSADARMFGTWMLVALNVTQNGGNIDWDWDMIILPDGFGFGDNGSIAGSCGRPTRLRAGSTSPATGGGFSFGHFIVTTGQTTGWLAGADTAWINETAAHRVWRLCKEEQLPVTIVGDNTMVDNFRGDPTYSRFMGPQRPKPLVELLQECADVDSGILYEDRAATGLAFRTGLSLTNQTAAATFDVALDGLNDPFQPVLDDQRIRNDITVKRDEGSTARITDDTSIATEGRYDEEVTHNVASDLQLPDQAGWRLHLRTWPELRLPAIATSLLKAGTTVTNDWIDLDLGDLLALDNLMRQYDETTAQLLEGYDETLSFFTWEAGLTTSPAGPWEVGVRDDDARGKRDTAGSELASSATTTATSLSVATTLGPVWSADNADDGFDINIGGERMTVTDISGTTSPQTFTVVRSINGVVKAHPAGADVRLWRPTVRAL